MQIGQRLRTVFMAAAAAVPAAFAATQATAQSVSGAVSASWLGIGVATPWILAGAAALPVLWWLSRHNPPLPRVENFPSLRLLLGYESEEVKPDSMPLWRKILRMAAAGAVVAGLAGPLLDPAQPLPGGEGDTILVVIDNDWAAAENWGDRQKAVTALMERAAREGRQVILMPTAESQEGAALELIGPLSPADAMRVFDTLEVLPWPADHGQALAVLEEAGLDNAAGIYWFGNGLTGEGMLDLSHALQDMGGVTYVQSIEDYNPKILSQTQDMAEYLTVTITRADITVPETVTVQAMDEQGYILGVQSAEFAAGDADITTSFELPEEVRAQVRMVVIDGENNAGATLLVDDNWRQRPVGIVKNENIQTASPLLRDAFYVETALQPYARIHSGNMATLSGRELAVQIVPDDVSLSEEEVAYLERWVENGGTLIRFAGPSLAQGQYDRLLPVDLLHGNRTLGGALTLEQPLTIDPFDRNSPFYGIDIADDILISRQVVARPDSNLPERIWASLSDGTPLVTAEQRGQGHIILFHVPSNAKYEWSNLPITGTFVNMLRRIIDHSNGVTGFDSGAEILMPWQILDARGRLGAPFAAAEGLSAEKRQEGAIGPRTPPGFYGDESVRVAYNLSDADMALAAMSDTDMAGMRVEKLSTDRTRDWTGYLLLAGLLALGADQMLRTFSITSMARGRRDEERVAKPSASL